MAAVQISRCPFIKCTGSHSIQQKYSLFKSQTLLYYPICVIVFRYYIWEFHNNNKCVRWFLLFSYSVQRMNLLYIIIYIQIMVFIYFSFIFEYWIFMLGYRQTLKAHFKAVPLFFPCSGFSPWAILLASVCLSHITVAEQGGSTCVWMCMCLCVCVCVCTERKEKKEKSGLRVLPAFHRKFMSSSQG